MTKNPIKEDVRNFYDQIGWQKVSSGVYQNAEYEDLRPVSRDYIHKCHLRVNRHLQPTGKYLLDAGSGPIQYPEYITYSAGYQYRVCLDLSIVALMDARERIEKHGLFVVADVAHLPFLNEVFEGVVSLHTLHHLAADDYLPAYRELRRVMKKGSSAVVVNGWDASPLMRFFRIPIVIMERISRNRPDAQVQNDKASAQPCSQPKRTFVHKLDASGLRSLLGQDFPVDILVWRSVSVRFLRAMIHPALLGGLWLKSIFLLEEVFPRFFGENGQYPLITFRKTEDNK